MKLLHLKIRRIYSLSIIQLFTGAQKGKITSFALQNYTAKWSQLKFYSEESCWLMKNSYRNYYFAAEKLFGIFKHWGILLDPSCQKHQWNFTGLTEVSLEGSKIFTNTLLLPVTNPVNWLNTWRCACHALLPPRLMHKPSFASQETAMWRDL